MKLGISAAVMLYALCACSSIIEGTSQEVTINTNPSGASCTLNRQGISVARIDPTPGSATIKKTKYDITVVCNKDGYQETTYLNHSGVAGATVGNIILGGGIGWAIDSASGADNKYDTPVNMTMLVVENKNLASKHRSHKTAEAEDDDTADETENTKTEITADGEAKSATLAPTAVSETASIKK